MCSGRLNKYVVLGWCDKHNSRDTDGSYIPASSWIYVYKTILQWCTLTFVILLQVALFPKDKTTCKVF